MILFGNTHHLNFHTFGLSEATLHLSLGMLHLDGDAKMLSQYCPSIDVEHFELKSTKLYLKNKSWNLGMTKFSHEMLSL